MTTQFPARGTTIQAGNYQLMVDYTWEGNAPCDACGSTGGFMKQPLISFHTIGMGDTETVLCYTCWTES